MGKSPCGSAAFISVYFGRILVFGLAEHQLSLSHHVPVQFRSMINVLLQDPQSEQQTIEMQRKSICLSFFLTFLTYSRIPTTQLELFHLEITFISSSKMQPESTVHLLILPYIYNVFFFLHSTVKPT